MVCFRCLVFVGTLTLGSWSHNGFLVNVTQTEDNADTSSYIPNGEWNLIGELKKKSKITQLKLVTVRFPAITT